MSCKWEKIDNTMLTIDGNVDFHKTEIKIGEIRSLNPTPMKTETWCKIQRCNANWAEERRVRIEQNRKIKILAKKMKMMYVKNLCCRSFLDLYKKVGVEDT